MYKVIEKVRKINFSDSYVEAGDLANEVGKDYLDTLFKSIERNNTKERKKLYFVVITKKDPRDINKIEIHILPLFKRNRPLKYLRESTDHWVYDYEKEKLELIWSVPHRIDMKNFLRSPEKYSKDIIHWIRLFLEQENLNLDDPRSQIVPLP